MSLQVCMERDKKGTYRRGLEGTSSTVPGLQDAYEAPVSPALAIDTTVTSSDVAADQIVALIPCRSAAVNDRWLNLPLARSGGLR